MTSYRLATSAADYKRCRALMATHTEPVPLSYPTVMAERDGEVIGFLSTQPRKEAIVAGPLFLRFRSPFVLVKLLDAYDNVMRAAGIVAYHFFVTPENAGWKQQIQRLGIVPWHEDDQATWYRRTLRGAA